jgi:CrcB protein
MGSEREPCEDQPQEQAARPSAADRAIVAQPGVGHHHAPGRGSHGPGRPDLGILGAISLGGAVGAPARYGVAQLVYITPGTLPWGTFWTNISGSFALGLVLGLFFERFPPSRFLRPFVATGFLGAYTTYSTFAVEADLLARNGHVAIALAYALGSLVAGVAAVWVGIVLARVFVTRRHTP